MKTLVVDDSSTIRRILMNILAQIGLTDVVEASDGHKAVETVKSQSIGLVLMDWNMPVMTGIEALKEIRAAGHLMPVIMITTEGERVRILEAVRAGATNYIIKPFKNDIVASKVQETLNAIVQQ